MPILQHIAKRCGQDPSGNGQDCEACPNPTGQDFGQESQRTVTDMPDSEHNPAANGLPELAFAPGNRRRVLQHLLALRSAHLLVRTDEQAPPVHSLPEER